MRRKDREITNPVEIDSIIRSEKLMRIALVDGEIPFLLPVFYGYDGRCLYFHSAIQGRKIEILKKNNNICFEISVDHGVIEDPVPCDFEAKHRTVIGLGRATFVDNEAEKITALDLIVTKFTPKKFTYPKARLEHTAVIRIDVQSLKGKKHGC